MVDDTFDPIQSDESSSETANSFLGAWLPSAGQIRSAFRMQLDDAIDGDDDTRTRLDGLPATSMRQGVGLVVATGLLAGFLPFVFDLFQALAYGTSVPLAQIANQWGTLDPAAGSSLIPLASLSVTAETVAGLEPIAPGWLAAILSALGLWINWPLGWLSSWIVYGLAVLVMAKLLGAPTTLQRFYAGVSYAFLPLLLVGLSPIPYVGWLFLLAGWVWALIVYVRAVRVVAEFDTLRAFVSVISPVLIGLLIGMTVALATALSVFRLFL